MRPPPWFRDDGGTLPLPSGPAGAKTSCLGPSVVSKDEDEFHPTSEPGVRRVEVGWSPFLSSPSSRKRRWEILVTKYKRLHLVMTENKRYQSVGTGFGNCFLPPKGTSKTRTPVIIKPISKTSRTDLRYYCLSVSPLSGQNLSCSTFLQSLSGQDPLTLKVPWSLSGQDPPNPGRSPGL